MKYIKLFENYTRTEFGVYTDKNKIESLWRSLEFDHPVNMPFTQDEKNELNSIMKPFGGSVYAEQGSAHIEVKTNICVVIRGYGDFCFGIFIEDINLPVDDMWIKCEIIDGFEDLCVSIKRIINEYKEL